ncbi:copper amine oxidase N-terminal domain-containing protein [Paenibacillus sp. sptzw28]|uniref:copper amine oxidase N-terminal domain-containing protein n=1 Tax=Paenibacillus sp. sptzw28 TaxID=715179 RepID=UPI001C6E4056|nr:copper amine oxidase N-terminal domain-containing protein [Paenibacillus sp. sptzw28]QYR22280.1 copper amine oxidase N-terminal domain-containing protein [Paenibacillus sp. sptzw28]
MKMKRIYMFGLAALLAVGVPAGTAGTAQAAEAAAPTAANVPTAAEDETMAVPVSSAIQASAVQRVQMGRSDMAYVPLFGSRAADQDAIAKTVTIANRLLKNAKPTTEQLVGEDVYFATSVDIKLTDGTDIYLQFNDSQQVYILVGEDKYIAQDATAINEFYALLAVPPQRDISTLKPAIGQTVGVTGSDAGNYKGTVRIFVETPGSSGGYMTAKGVGYPSKRALLVFTAPYIEARYNFQFTMPAYGEAIDGTFKPITPGIYDLYIDTGWSRTSQRVMIAPPAAPALAINGVAVNDSALAPVVSNGVMLLPMRALAESFGWYVRWDAAHKAAFVSTQPDTQEINQGSSATLSLWVNGKQLTGVNAKPVIKKGRVYLPLRATSEAFGFQLTWTPSVRGTLLVFKPQLLDEGAYAGEAKKLAATKLLNGYVNAMNSRDAVALGRMFVKNGTPAQLFEIIGQRLITGIRSVTFEDRPGGALLAYVTFSYLFDPYGNKSGTPGIVFMQENGTWKISDVD